MCLGDGERHKPASHATGHQVPREIKQLNDKLSADAQKFLEGDVLPGVSGRAAKSLALKLGARILIGEFEDGQRMPPERDLAMEYAVSRTTVRRGLDILETSGLIVRRSRSGTFVSCQTQIQTGAGDDGEAAAAANQTGLPAAGAVTETPSLDLAEISDMTSPLELNIVRSILEPEIARLAVINMSSKDISKLRTVIERMELVTTDAVAFSRCDEDFYTCLAEGTHNPLLTALYDMVTIVRRGSSQVHSQEKPLPPGRIREFKQNHRSLYQAVCARDIEGAVEFIKLQMTEIQRDLMRDF